MKIGFVKEDISDKPQPYGVTKIGRVKVTPAPTTIPDVVSDKIVTGKDIISSFNKVEAISIKTIKELVGLRNRIAAIGGKRPEDKEILSSLRLKETELIKKIEQARGLLNRILLAHYKPVKESPDV